MAEVNQNLPSIPQFYANKVVFITGGLGYIGKVVVEKLLRSCPDVDKIYLLARAKKGKDVSERFEDYIKTPVFDTIHEKNPEAFKKIKLIKGDITEDDFGMSQEDQKLFFDTVNIIIHSAASLNFDDPLKIAVNTNLKPMKTLLGFARRTKNLDAFVHISTAFTNWFLPEAKEQFYPMKLDPNELIEKERITDQKTMEKLLPPLLGQHTNTYTLTKSLSETLIYKEAKGIPMSIVRPSMVISCQSEPKPGWIDSWAAITYYGYLSGIGLMRAVHMIGENTADIVCGDFVSNMVIAAAWKTAMERKNLPVNNDKLPTIYNCCSNSENWINWKGVWDGLQKGAKEHPFADIVFYPNFKLRKTKFTSELDIFIKHMIPAYAMDAISKARGKKARLVKMQKNVTYNLEVVRYVTAKTTNFTTENVPKLRESMSAIDQATFYFDFRKVNYNKTLSDYHMGIRRYLMKQNDNSIPAARRKISRLKMNYYATIGTFAAVSILAVGGLAKCFLKRDQQKSEN